MCKSQLTFFPPTEKPLSEEAAHTSLEAEAVALGVMVGGIGVSVGAWVRVGGEVLVGVGVEVEKTSTVGVKVADVTVAEVGVRVGNVPSVAEGAGP